MCLGFFFIQLDHLPFYVFLHAFFQNIWETLGYTFICLFLCSSVKLWASAFGGEIKSISAKYSGSQLLQKVLYLFPSLARMQMHFPFVRWSCSYAHYTL